MTPIFPPRPPVLVPIHGQATGFPVRRIYCVGRNYADHAREMGSDPAREPPFFFARRFVQAGFAQGAIAEIILRLYGFFQLQER